MNQERASAEEIAQALDIHGQGCDEIVIDDDALISRSEHGYFIQAWLWVSTESLATTESEAPPT